MMLLLQIGEHSTKILYHSFDCDKKSIGQAAFLASLSSKFIYSVFHKYDIDTNYVLE